MPALSSCSPEEDMALTDPSMQEEFHRKLIERAWKDPAFRQRLVADPKPVIEEMFGIELPEGLDLKVLTETQNSLYIVIPSNPAEFEEKPLTSEELKGVAGGHWHPSTHTFISCTFICTHGPDCTAGPECGGEG
jgi:hypothetical protein